MSYYYIAQFLKLQQEEIKVYTEEELYAPCTENVKNMYYTLKDVILSLGDIDVDVKKHYIAYTDNSLDETGNIQVYASIFDPNAKNTELIPIETDREWKIVETILESLQEEQNKDN